MKKILTTILVGTFILGAQAASALDFNFRRPSDNASLGILDLDLGFRVGISSFVVLPSGNIGIGTTNPSTKLDVRGAVIGNSSGTFSTLYADGSNITGDALDLLEDPIGSKTFGMGINALKFTFANTTAAGALELNAIGAFTGDILHVHQHTGNPGVTTLAVFEAEDSDVTAVRITGVGDVSLEVEGNAVFDSNVGIGTTAPTDNFEVQGTVRLSTTATAGYGLIVESDGQVGLNTAAGTDVTLHVKGADPAKRSIFRLEGGGPTKDGRIQLCRGGDTSCPSISNVGDALTLDGTGSGAIALALATAGDGYVFMTNASQGFGIGGDISPNGQFAIKSLRGPEDFVVCVSSQAGTDCQMMNVLGNGNVGIGTTAPGDRLDINGTVRIRGGTPAAGKFWGATDVNGNGSWQTPAGGGDTLAAADEEITGKWTFTQGIESSSGTTYGSPSVGSSFTEFSGQSRWIKHLSTATWPSGAVMCVEDGGGYLIAITSASVQDSKCSLVVLLTGPAGAGTCAPGEFCDFATSGLVDAFCDSGTVGNTIGTSVSPGVATDWNAAALGSNGVIRRGPTDGKCRVILNKGF